ncbi:zinc ribbon domain-containing protein [Paenibacillus sp. YYML68]|uniref:zinc ribbon domain-containing protein n=1 Tax=Paenibacillus sp. YYML68 TaxID=2909250 RepID=UPI002493C12D|nr:zinc-ribbon domain-containing protein [Paenibacillus sp. YYML68]
MRSIKPGRGPSAMGAVASLAMGVFGMIWTIGVASMGAPIFFVLFGFVFIGIAVVQGIYHFTNATSRNRMSMYEITDRNEEPDPLNRYVAGRTRGTGEHREPYATVPLKRDMNFCPYCGSQLSDATFNYCPKCGKELRG